MLAPSRPKSPRYRGEASLSSDPGDGYKLKYSPVHSTGTAPEHHLVYLDRSSGRRDAEPSPFVGTAVADSGCDQIALLDQIQQLHSQVGKRRPPMGDQALEVLNSLRCGRASVVEENAVAQARGFEHRDIAGVPRLCEERADHLGLEGRRCLRWLRTPQRQEREQNPRAPSHLTPHFLHVTSNPKLAL